MILAIVQVQNLGFGGVVYIYILYIICLYVYMHVYTFPVSGSVVLHSTGEGAWPPCLQLCLSSLEPVVYTADLMVRVAFSMAPEGLPETDPWMDKIPCPPVGIFPFGLSRVHAC